MLENLQGYHLILASNSPRRNELLGGLEWIGFVGVERIEGSYFNMMGLPVHQLYTELKRFPPHPKTCQL